MAKSDGQQSEGRAVGSAVLSAVLLSACASSDPSVIRYGDLACERTAASPDVPRRCWTVKTLADELRREERGTQEPAR